MTATHHTILIAGLGEVAQTHLRVLEQTPGADVIAGADPAHQPQLTFHGHPVPVYPALADAAAHHQPGTVVIATPTPTHAALCAQAASLFPAARILVEKPAATSLADAQHVLEDIGSRQPVEVAYHMAYSPEVTWGLQVTHDNAGLGVPAAAEASFTDPYSARFDEASSRLGSSWLDSGINALSILSRFAEPIKRQSLRRIGEETRSVYEAHLTCQAAGTELEALLLTSWHVTDPAKTTRITYSSGAELLLDHTAVAGYLKKNGRITAVYGSDPAIPRRDRHYLALYKHWLTDGKPLMPAQASLRLHELLLQPPED